MNEFKYLSEMCELKRKHKTFQNRVEKDSYNIEQIDYFVATQKSVLLAIYEENPVDEIKKMIRSNINKYEKQRSALVSRYRKNNEKLTNTDQVIKKTRKEYNDHVANLVDNVRPIVDLFKKTEESFLEMTKCLVREDKLEKELGEKITELLEEKYSPDKLKLNMINKIEKIKPKTMDQMYETITVSLNRNKFIHIPLDDRINYYDFTFKATKPEDEFTHYIDVFNYIHHDLFFDIVVWSIINKDLPEDFLEQF